MKLTLFRCPATGKLVPCFIAEHPNPDDIYRFVSVHCDACGLSHLINRATGNAVGQDD